MHLFILLEQTEGDDVEIGCPITCGDCKAVLLVKKFVCPGINVKCVKVGIHHVFFLIEAKWELQQGFTIGLQRKVRMQLYSE